MQQQRVGGSTVMVLAANEYCVGGHVGRAGRGGVGLFLVNSGWWPRNKEGRKAAAAARQGRRRRLRGEEGSSGRTARKAAAAARQGRQRQPRGKDSSGGMATKVVAAQ
jgi:hypothetical protein